MAIKQLGTNGGGFFNANSTHPLENPTPLSNLLETLAILLIPGCPLLHLRPHGGRPAPGLGAARGDERRLPGATLRPLAVGRAATEPGLRRPRARPTGPATRSPAATWRARSCASASAPRRCGRWPPRRPPTGPSTRLHDSLTPLGGLVPMWLMQLGRGHLRRRRFGALRHARLRDHRRVHRGADGRPYAGIPRQEDRDLRDEDGGPRRPDPAAARTRRHGRCGGHSAAESARWPTPARMASPRYSTRSRPQGNNNGSAFGGLATNNAPSTMSPLGLAMLVGPLLADRPRAGDRRRRSPPRRRVPAGAGHPAHPHPRCSWVGWSCVVLSWWAR